MPSRGRRAERDVHVEFAEAGRFGGGGGGGGGAGGGSVGVDPGFTRGGGGGEGGGVAEGVLDEEVVVGLGVWEGGGELVMGFLRGFAGGDVFFQGSAGDGGAELGERVLDGGGEGGEGGLDEGGSGGNVGAYVADTVVGRNEVGAYAGVGVVDG